jgi:hypothetical protein
VVQMHVRYNRSVLAYKKRRPLAFCKKKHSLALCQDCYRQISCLYPY